MHLNRVHQEVTEYVKVLERHVFVIVRRQHQAKCRDVYVLQLIESELLQIKQRVRFLKIRALPNSI